MSKTRASIFDEPEELDISGFTPKTASDTAAPPPEKVREVSEAANFRSREPATPAPGVGGRGTGLPPGDSPGRKSQLVLLAGRSSPGNRQESEHPFRSSLREVAP